MWTVLREKGTILSVGCTSLVLRPRIITYPMLHQLGIPLIVHSSRECLIHYMKTCVRDVMIGYKRWEGGVEIV